MVFVMPDRSRTPKRPRDPNQLGKLIVDISTGLVENAAPFEDEKNAAAVALGRLGGLKGGKARAENMTKKRAVGVSKKSG
jgi:hypothetical protein